MNDIHPGAEGRPPGLIVLLTIIGVVLIASTIFLAQTLDDTYSAIFATDHILIPASSVGQVLLVKRIAFLFLLPIFGLLCDLLGRRSWLIGGAFILGVSIMTKAVASTMLVYFAAEIGFSIGLAMALPALFALALEACWTHHLLASVAGGMLLIQAFMSVLLPVLSAKIAEASGIRWSFGIASGGVLLATVFGGMLLLISGFMARHRRWSEHRIEAPRGRGAFIVIIGLLMTIFLIYLVNIVTSQMIIYFVKYTPGLDITSIGIIFLGYKLGFIATLIVAAPMADLFEFLLGRRNQRSLSRPVFVMVGCVVFCAGSTLFRFSDSLAGATAAMVFLGAGSGLLMPSLIALLVSNIKHRWWATVISINQAACVLGIMVAGVGVPWMLSLIGYIPSVEQSAETITGFRTIFSITIAIGLSALAFGIMAAIVQMTSRSTAER